MSARRWRREDWLAFGEAQLKSGGRAALTLDALCERAGRTKGSFYHHFSSTEAFVAALVDRWREQTTESLARAALEASSPEEGRKRLARLSNAIDPELEVAMRRAAGADPAIAERVAEADERREAVIATLLAASFNLAHGEAVDAARLLHSLQLAGQMRAPADVAQFTRAPTKLLLGMLDRTAKDRRAPTGKRSDQ